MNESLRLEHDLMTRHPVDLQLLEIMARDFESMHHTITEDPQARQALLTIAQNYAIELFGCTPVFVATPYALTDDGVEFNATVVGAVRGVRPAKFLSPDDAISSLHVQFQPWGYHGLGLVIEPLNDTGADGDNALMELQGYTSLYREMTIPLNGNIVYIGKVAVVN